MEATALKAATTKAAGPIKAAAIATARKVQWPLVERLTLQATLVAELASDLVDGEMVWRLVSRAYVRSLRIDPLVDGRACRGRAGLGRNGGYRKQRQGQGRAMHLGSPISKGDPRRPLC
ncbi:hypothetical protein [Ensifer sp. MJa1]|uniref:hypothetical protein n=1 Tax=Ensifer sp. MJa1 TaxID=2919888 RepID=UPI00300A4077